MQFSALVAALAVCSGVLAAPSTQSTQAQASAQANMAGQANLAGQAGMAGPAGQAAHAGQSGQTGNFWPFWGGYSYGYPDTVTTVGGSKPDA